MGFSIKIPYNFGLIRMKIGQRLTGFEYDNGPSKTVIRSTGMQISIPSNRYDDLDTQLLHALREWICQEKYKKYALELKQDLSKDSEWSERTIISRIKKQLNHPTIYGLPGIITIRDINDRIVLIWTEKK